MIVYLRHIDCEGPGLLWPAFAALGHEQRLIALDQGEPLPDPGEPIDAVVSLGGPMNVDETDKHPFLRQEMDFIRCWVKAGGMFLGLCLGSQLLAKAFGAEVKRSPVKELGFFDVGLTEAASRDPLFDGMPERWRVFQWHEDMWTLPEGGILLAQATGCPHQAFRIGEAGYGLQFHMEVDEAMTALWCDRYLNPDEADAFKQKLAAAWSECSDAWRKGVDRFARNMSRRIKQRTGTGA